MAEGPLGFGSHSRMSLDGGGRGRSFQTRKKGQRAAKMTTQGQTDKTLLVTYPN